MLEQLNGDHPIIMPWMLEFISDHISGHYFQVRQAFLRSLLVDEDLLRCRVGKSSDLSIGKDLSEVERGRAPSASQGLCQQ